MVLSLKYGNSYYLENGEKLVVYSNESLSKYIGCDIVNGYSRYLSLSDKIYIYFKHGDIYFSKKIKSFIDINLPHERILLNDDALAAYLGAGFIAPPFTLFENIYIIPSYSLISINDSLLTIKNYYPDDYDSLKYTGFADIKDFESFLQEIIIEELGVIDEKINIICTLSGGADSSLILKILSNIVPKDKITSITCVMTGLESEAKKAEDISRLLRITNRQYKYTKNDSGKILTEFISKYNTPVYDPICPIYTSMIESLNDDIDFSEKTNIIVEGQCADSVLLGLPHNFLLQLYNPQFSILSRSINSLVPVVKNKNRFYKRLIYRFKKIVSSLGQSTWIDCLLKSLDLNVLSMSPYIKHLRKQLSEYYQHYGSIHKAIAHFFMFRIIQVREMQKYAVLPHNYKVVIPFADTRFVCRAFKTKESFFIERGKRKKPIFDLVEKYFPNFYSKQKTTPFYVEYKVSNRQIELNKKLKEDHDETVKSLKDYDVDRELKIQSLNLLYSLILKNRKV